MEKKKVLVSLFSGIGGFELAAEWMGWEVGASCEINDFGRKILEYYWSDALHHDDVHTFTLKLIDEQFKKRFGENWRDTTDIILSGGFPCQPYSQAGKRLGKEDERHLWPEMLRIIAELKPRWVVGENVYGLLNWNGGLVFEEVQTDLENEGYEVQPYILPACAVNAPHRRDRIWFVAHTRDNDGSQQGQGGSSEGKAKNLEESREWSEHSEQSSELVGLPRTSSDTESKRSGGLRDSSEEKGSHDGNELLGVEHRMEGEEWIDSNPNSKRHKRGELDGSPNERYGTRKSHEPTSEFRKAGDWEQFPTQPPVCGGNDGIPRELDGITFPKWRNESIKAYGNAIVPQVALQIFKAIDLYEQQYAN